MKTTTKFRNGYFVASDPLPILSELFGGADAARRFLAAARADRRSARVAGLFGAKSRGPSREDLARLHAEFARCGFAPDLFRNIEYTYALSRVRAAKGRRWIDLGCGDSPFMALALAENSAESVALVDVDPKALDAQRANMKALGVDATRVRYVEADLTADRPLAGETGRFGGAVVVSAIEHVSGDGDVRSMERLWELLEQGAPVVVTVPASPEYDEVQSIHYHGLFERRYDLRGFFARLQPNGFELDEALFVNHAEGRAAAIAREEFGDLNEFFARWYGGFSVRADAPAAALLLSEALLQVSPAPSRGTVGIMATLRRGEKRAVDALPRRATADGVARIALPEPAEPAQGIRLFSPHRHIVMDWRDRVVVPLVLVNLWDRTIPAQPIAPGEFHIGVHLKSVLREGVEWDYAHIPMPVDLPAKSMTTVSIAIPAPKDLCDFEFAIDICKEGEYWQGDVALEPVSVRVTLR